MYTSWIGSTGSTLPYSAAVCTVHVSADEPESVLWTTHGEEEEKQNIYWSSFRGILLKKTFLKIQIFISALDKYELLKSKKNPQFLNQSLTSLNLNKSHFKVPKLV